MKKTLWAPSFAAAVCLVTVGLAAQAPSTAGQEPSDQAPTAPAPRTSAPRPSQGSSASADASKKITLSGCIERQAPGAQAAGAANMPFSLTGATAVTGNAPVGTSGTEQAAAKTYRLDATEAMVSPHVGHKVEITGMVEDQPSAAASATASGANASASSGANSPRLKVDSVKMVAATCQP